MLLEQIRAYGLSNLFSSQLVTNHQQFPCKVQNYLQSGWNKGLSGAYARQCSRKFGFGKSLLRLCRMHLCFYGWLPFLAVRGWTQLDILSQKGLKFLQTYGNKNLLCFMQVFPLRTNQEDTEICQIVLKFTQRFPQYQTNKPC